MIWAESREEDSLLARVCWSCLPVECGAEVCSACALEWNGDWLWAWPLRQSFPIVSLLHRCQATRSAC